MYVLTHPKHGETTVKTELAYTRHLAAGWMLKAPEEKPAEMPKADKPKRKAK